MENSIDSRFNTCYSCNKKLNFSKKPRLRLGEMIVCKVCARTTMCLSGKLQPDGTIKRYKRVRTCNQIYKKKRGKT